MSDKGKGEMTVPDKIEKHLDFHVLCSVLQKHQGFHYRPGCTYYFHSNAREKRFSDLKEGEDYFMTEDDLKSYVHQKFGWVGPKGKEFLSSETHCISKEIGSNTSMPTQKIMPTHLYGKDPTPTIGEGLPTDGVCSGCFGKRDLELDDEPILLCDGPGCTREYHLSCTFPLLNSVPKGDFFCIDCDPEGTSRCLKKYFDAAEDARSEFESSKQYVEHLIKTQIKDLDSETESGENILKGVPLSNGFVAYNGQPIFSELERINDICAAAFDDFMWRGTKPFSEQKKTGVRQYHSEDLVGHVLKLYCPTDNTYHTGRILDWRLCALPGTDLDKSKFFCGKGEIACTEFLIRFSSGADGRKTSILQWIILEEHCCAISAGVVYACKDIGRGIHGWKPAQLMIRTRLELLPVRKLLSYSGYFSLVTYFGTDSHMYLNVEEEVCSFYSKPFLDSKERQEKSCYTSSASFIMNKQMYDLGEHLAKLELDEERRVYQWSKNYCSYRPYSKREFSVIDQYSEDLQIASRDACPGTSTKSHSTDVDPSMIEMEYTEMNTSKSTDAKKFKTSNKEAVNETENSVQKQIKQPFPLLCTKIQRGLDLQWIASNLDTLSTDRSYEALESMTANSDLPISTMMATLNEEKRIRNI